MTQQLKYILRTRALFTEVVEQLSIEELNRIPMGFNNNIIWNYGHLVVSTLNLCYVRTGIEKNLQISYFDRYLKGTKPEKHIEQEEVDTLKQDMISSIAKLEQDYEIGLFNEITPYSTETYAVKMSSIEEVITCALAHDNLHLGYAFAQRKAIKAQSTIK